MPSRLSRRVSQSVSPRQPHISPQRPPTQRWLAALLASALLLPGLPACSHGAAPADGAAPLPPGWSRPPQHPQPYDWPGRSAPLWGVPAFEPPSATDCNGPPRVSEQPGRPQQRPQPLAERDDARRRAPDMPAAKSAAPPADTVLAAPPTTPSAAPATSPAMAGRVADSAGARGTAVPAPPPAQNVQRPAPPSETVTAGMVDDNADFGEYQAFRRRAAHLSPRDRDSSERYRVELRDAANRPVADAEVALSWPGAPESLRFARTDGAGQAWLLPRLLLPPSQLGRLQTLEVQARATSGEVVRTALQRGQKAAVQLRLYQAAEQPAQGTRVPLDLVFLVDATGSMGDEIAKLRDSLRTIASRVGALPSRPDLCWGLVAYRDRGDAFLTRTHDLTADLGSFQQALQRLQAGGGGDYPEALNEALDETVHHISWRGPGTSRLVVLVADAPPHLDRGAPYYDQAAAAAAARGIKLHAVGASGLDAQGEVVFRQLAQSTGGRFVFLTYRDARRPGSGPGSDTVHDVHDYSVDTLDDLIVGLVRDELAPRTVRTP